MILTAAPITILGRTFSPRGPLGIIFSCLAVSSIPRADRREYLDERPVVIGHYWRWPTAVDRGVFEKDGPDLFAGTHAREWLGPKRNVFCVDFSIGRRFRERELGYTEGSCAKLGALRWPERELVFDSGEVHTTE